VQETWGIAMPDKSKNVHVVLSKSGGALSRDDNTYFISKPGKSIWKNKWRAGRSGWFPAKITWHLPNKKGMGRAKGNTLERKTAKELSLWIYDKEDYLRRTPLSGGWANAKAGDIILDHSRQDEGAFNPKMYVECRSYKDILQYDLLSWADTGKPNTLTKWFKEVDKKRGKFFPMLVVKGNHTKPWILMKADWLTRNTILYFKLLSCGVMNPSNHGKILLIPLTDLGNLRDGKYIIKKWREDNASTNAGRHS